MMVKLRVVGILLCFAGLCLADSEYKDRRARFTEVSTKRYPNYIGFATGSFSGEGLSYKRWFDKWALQLTMFPWYEEAKYPDYDDDDIFYYSNERDSGYSNKGTASIGLVYSRSIHEARFFRIYAQGGGSWYLDYHKYDYYSNEYRNGTNVPVRFKGKTTKNTVSLGAGCGVEFFFWRFCVHFTTGIFGSKRSDDLKKIGLEGGTGIYFRL